jgi:predicted nuclease of predicted toxin-antitoxin system
VKLLLDHNLSHRLLSTLTPIYPGSTHTKLEGMERADDSVIWEFAKREGFTIVTQDSDFSDRVDLLGHPPKVIWLRCGNTATSHIATLLARHRAAIESFENESDSGCLELY